MEAMVLTENDIAKVVVDAAMEVHRVIGGPGLFENIYEEALAAELTLRNLPFERQKRIPVQYKEQTLTSPLVLDLLVDGRVIIECKATEKHNPLYETQTLTYLRVCNLKLGLVINFGERMLKDGIKRVVNGL